MTPWRACGESRVPGIPRRAIESLHASHVHSIARRWARSLQPGTATRRSRHRGGERARAHGVRGQAREGEHPSVATAATPTERVRVRVMGPGNVATRVVARVISALERALRHVRVVEGQLDNVYD